jgi:hypothetical protein
MTTGPLLTEAGFEQLVFCGEGRLTWLWQSMLIAGRKAQRTGIEP